MEVRQNVNKEVKMKDASKKGNKYRCKQKKYTSYQSNRKKEASKDGW